MSVWILIKWITIIIIAFIGLCGLNFLLHKNKNELYISVHKCVQNWPNFIPWIPLPVIVDFRHWTWLYFTKLLAHIIIVIPNMSDACNRGDNFAWLQFTSSHLQPIIETVVYFSLYVKDIKTDPNPFSQRHSNSPVTVCVVRIVVWIVWWVKTAIPTSVNFRSTIYIWLWRRLRYR